MRTRHGEENNSWQEKMGNDAWLKVRTKCRAWTTNKLMFQCFAIKCVPFPVLRVHAWRHEKSEMQSSSGEKNTALQSGFPVVPTELHSSFCWSGSLCGCLRTEGWNPIYVGKKPAVLLLWVHNIFWSLSALPRQLQRMVVEYIWDFWWSPFFNFLSLLEKKQKQCAAASLWLLFQWKYCPSQTWISVKHWTFICLLSETRLFCRLPSRLRMPLLAT